MNDVQQAENSEDDWSESEDTFYDDKNYCSISSIHGFLNGHDYHKVNDDIELHRKINVITDSKEAHSDEQCWDGNENKRKRVDVSGKFIKTSREHNHISNHLRRTRKTSREELPELNDELLNGYKILQHLMSPTNKNVNSLFMDRNDAVKHFTDYYDGIREPIWLNKVKVQLLSGKYSNITEVVHDIRLILENCYDFYGHNHSVTKRALKLEFMLEQKLALLPREMRDKTTLEATSPLLIKAAGSLLNGTRPPVSSNDTSQILFYVTNSKLWKEKTNRKRHLEEKKAVKEANYVHVIEWERQLTEDHLTAMKAMWELPQIGHFLFLAQSALNIPELHMYELERIFLMPRESRYLAVIITSLLSTPFQRTKLHQRPPMPYRIWKERVKLRVDNWYKLYYNRRSTEKVFKAYGVEPDFFRVLGETNPLEEKDFHELSFHQRVWIVKSLCDYCLHTHKTVQDAINENSLSDQKEFILGVDKSGKSYVHFPQFCGQDLRIYCQSSSSDLLISNGIKLDVKNGDVTIKRKSSKKYKSIQPDIKKFELIVDGVESLRQLINKFSINKDMLLSKNARKKEKQEQVRCELDLCERLYNLLDELERWESKLQNVVKRTQMRLKQEFDDYQTMLVAGEEDVDDIWGTEPDEEEQQPIDSPCGDVSNSEDDLSISLCDSDSSAKRADGIGKRKCRAKQKQYSIVSEDEENESLSDFEMSISSRGRLRKTRRVNLDESDYLVKTRMGSQSYKSSNFASECHVMKDYISNSTHEAKGQYQWETWRQIIISTASSEMKEVSEETDQTKSSQTVSSLDESLKSKAYVEQKSNTNCLQKNEKSDINYQEETVVPENVMEEKDKICNEQTSRQECNKNCQEENVREESNIGSCQQDVAKYTNFQSSDLQSFEENYSEIPSIGNNVEIDMQTSTETGVQDFSEIHLQDTVSEENTVVNQPSVEKLVTSTTETCTVSEVSHTESSNPSKTTSQQMGSNDSKSVKLAAPRPVSRLKSSGLFLHIPPREVVYGTERAITNNVTDNQVANLAVDKNSTTKESDKKNEPLLTKNKTVDQTANKIKSRKTNKGPQNYQVFNFKLPSKSASAPPKLDRSVFQPAITQLNSVVHLIPAVDQKGNKIFLQYTANVPVQASSNENKQDRQKTHSPLILNVPTIPANTRTVLSNSANVSSCSIPFLLPVKHGGVSKVASLTTLPVQRNLPNSASNVVFSTSGCTLPEKSPISPLNTHSQTVLSSPPLMNTTIIPHVTFQQSNNANFPVNSTQALKVAQNTQNSAKIALFPQLKSNSTSNSTTKVVPTTSDSVRLKPGPPPLGPITSTRKTPVVSSSPNRQMSKECNVKLTKNDSSFLELPPLGPITSPASSKLKIPKEDTVKSRLLPQTSGAGVTLSNSTQNSVVCSQAVTKLSSAVSSGNSQFNICSAASSITSSKAPVKLMVSPTISNSNYQFITTPPTSTVPPTRVILSCSNISASSVSASSGILLSSTAKPQTVLAETPTITMPAEGNSNRIAPNILTKQLAKAGTKTPTLLTTTNSTAFNLSTNLTCEKDGIRTLNGAAVLNSSPNNAKMMVSTNQQSISSVAEYNSQQLFLLTSNGQLMQLNKVDTRTANQVINATERCSSTQQNVSFLLSPLPSQVLGSTTELKNL